MRIAVELYLWGQKKFISCPNAVKGIVGIDRTNYRKQRGSRAAWFVLIVAAASTIGMIAAWRAPELNLYAQDLLMRSRGVLPEPDNIVIVAIDETSIAKLGRFPWNRKQAAQAIDIISSAKPRAIALDVLYSEPSEADADKALADAVKRSGNVVIGEQLVENRETPELGRSEWLRAMPMLRSSANGVGHVNVETEHDGTARELLLKITDDDGDAAWALALETVRAGDGLAEDDISEAQNFVRMGTRRLPFESNERNLFINTPGPESKISSARPLRLRIDYIGPTGSFADHTYSFSDLLDGKVSPDKLRDKYVLIGATAATLGDRLATPFVHTENAEGDQHGDLMPGVEILANSVNTIVQNHFYRPVADWQAWLAAVLTAIAVLFLLGLAQGRSEALKQIVILSAVFAAIVGGSYLLYAYAFLIPPVIPVVTSFVVAAPLALLRRSLSASATLDERIAELVAAGGRLFTDGRDEAKSGPIDRSLVGGDRFEPGNEFGSKNLLIPHGLEWKSETLGYLSRDLIARALFIDSALRSIDDGLLIADIDGSITFANEKTLKILDLPKRKLVGSDLFERLRDAAGANAAEFASEETRASLILDRKTIEREVVIGKGESRNYVVRISTVVDRDGGSDESVGLIATLSDVTYLKQLQQTKNDVIALVSHELRTPLTVIQGMSELLTEHEVEAEPRRKMLETINHETKRLARMINQYLDITRLESGSEKIEFVPVDIESFVSQRLLLIEPLASRSSIKLEGRFPTGQTTILADPERLSQAVTNILANAIKYSPPKTTITVETKVIGHELQIIVTDEGRGISPEHVPHIFEKFYRVGQGNNEVPGTGLGLAFAREIAELHSGSISMESELGKGSVFTIHLPLFAEKERK